MEALNSQKHKKEETSNSKNHNFKLSNIASTSQKTHKKLVRTTSIEKASQRSSQCSTNCSKPSSSSELNSMDIIKSGKKLASRNRLVNNKGTLVQKINGPSTLNKKKPSPDFGKRIIIGDLDTNRTQNLQKDIIPLENFKNNLKLPSAFFEYEVDLSHISEDADEDEFTSSCNNQLELEESVYTLNMSNKNHVPTFTEFCDFRKTEQC